MSTSARISIDGLERIFDDGKNKDGVHALGPISFEVAEGEFVCVLGPSGCGKSTLLRVLAGLITPTGGKVEIKHRNPTRSLVGMVFQDHSIYPWKTVEENVRFGLDLSRKLSKDERSRVAASYIERLGLSRFAKAFPNTLSGGMRQRVAIARALAIEPELILMDEPFAALDAQLRMLMQDALVELWEADRRTVVFITHSIEEAIFLADRVIVMTARPGQICAEYVVPFSRPRSLETRGEPGFAQLHEKIWQVLRVEVDKHLSEGGADGHAA